MPLTPAAFAGVMRMKVGFFEMRTTTHPKTAACQQADHTQSALAIIWTFQVGNPKWGEKFASLLDRRLKQILPEGRLRDLLEGQESEIRQRAALLLLQSYLNGNRILQSATEREDLAEVANQIQRSINASLRLASCRVRRALDRDRKRFTELDESVHSSSVMHPAWRKKVSELPFEARRSLLLMLLEDGVRARSISKANSHMVREMIDSDMTQADMAREIGISRPAVHQRISSVGAAIAASLEKTEFPIL